MFGNPIPAPAGGQKFGLFGQSAAAKPADTTDAAAKPSGLFGSGPAKPASSLFGASAPGGLFGNAPPASGGLFGAPAASGSGSLFGNANSGPSIFKFGGDNNAKAADNNKSDDDENDAEEEGEKSPPIYADSTTKVEFKGAGAQTIQPSPYTKLFEVSKIRNRFLLLFS